MAYVVLLGLVGLVVGLIGVASNPSPYFAAFGLVVAAAAGCMVLVGIGVSFLSLVLFLIYLGGMLVVFAYSAAMAAEPYPEAWGDLSVIFYVMLYVGVMVTGGYMVNGLDSLFIVEELRSVDYGWGGVAMLYDLGGFMLLVSGWVLLLTLFVVLEVTRGVGSSAIGGIK
uniref:NADH-ubiquinone oxidoreductase chain 6 n=1 Tax=Boulengerula boulengeri TaxID=260983 RepID=C9D879_BOUBO|nr:NADH dehydrogenase subunit 6 [Boulengerula boulengeri]ACS37012.1 NADH dehydrogenase subunit 6 [Boulengerula boulengeri]